MVDRHMTAQPLLCNLPCADQAHQPRNSVFSFTYHHLAQQSSTCFCVRPSNLPHYHYFRSSIPHYPLRKMQPEPHEFEFAIICALPREFDAVEALLDERYSSLNTPRHFSDSNYYTTGRMGVSNVVVICLLEMGKASAAKAATTLRSSFPNISLILAVGICGGVPFPTPDTELILGDVIISHQVVKFDFGRQFSDRFERKGVIKETLDRSNAAVLSVLAGLPTREMKNHLRGLHTRYLKDLQVQSDSIWCYPGVDKDRLYPASCEHNAPAGVEEAQREPATDCTSVGCIRPLITRMRLSNGTNPQPCIHLGPIASGDVVMKSASHRDKLAREENIVGFEMEGAGICESLASLVIKGVCDYADSHKNKEWQDYAAASGAACAKAFLECLTSITYHKCALYMSSRMFQTGIGGESHGRVSQSRYYTISQAFTHMPTRRSSESTQSTNVPINHHESGTPVIKPEQSVVPSTMDTAQTVQNQVIKANRVVFLELCKTFFGTIYYHSQDIQKQVTVDDETAEQNKSKTSFVFHPASWLVRLGIRYGINAIASSQHGSWQYSLRPVHVVPDDSLIFRFCETGNIEAVREMLTRGEAFINDTDTRGWTLLHIAAKEGQSKMAKFLITHGADKQAYAYQPISKYRNHHTPETFIQGTAFRQGHIQVLSLFRDCIEFSEPNCNGWSLLAIEAEGFDGSERFTPQLAHEYYSTLIQCYRGEISRTLNVSSVWYDLFLADQGSDSLSINKILDFVPDQKGYTEIVSDDLTQMSFNEYLGDCFMVLEILTERGADIQAIFGGETPTSRSLRFSPLFFLGHPRY
ncbi:hypothetical protein BJY04DRAFT_183537 [Aspergillus karnatakaensis]|uniref:uncharacterized protein n=1 Tax=Aspergillus karnatakaensis TaxID=1810916 RepID=UPI003CCCF4D9